MNHDCVRSGFCCKQGICPYGVWNSDLHQCQFLEGEKVGDYSCSKYEEIIADPLSKFSPAFGEGCSSALNPDRLVLIRKGGEHA